MKNLNILLIAGLIGSGFALAGCGASAPTTGVPNQGSDGTEVKVDYQTQADNFLRNYNEKYAALEHEYALGYWKAANSGKKEDWDKYSAAELALKKFHSEKEPYETISGLLEHKADLADLTARGLEVAELAYKGNQLPAELLEQLVAASSEIEQGFASFRATVNGKTMSNNEMLEALGKSQKTKERKELWEGLKQVGTEVGDKLVALAKLRNAAALQLGYANYWQMQVSLQEYDPAVLLALFDELEQITNEPFKKMKGELDAELSQRFKIKADKMMPWHYDNPFFQAAPPSAKVNLDEFYKDKPKEEIMEVAKKFFLDIGLPCEDVIANSDLYEREGKDQHAFCITIDRKKDVRTLLNIKPTAEWMDTSLHEEGHAIFYTGINEELPYNLREAAHIFTTEGIAMLFGALGKNPKWMVEYAGADAKRIGEVEGAILEQRRREQLIFARWAMVMLHFEKSLYENPDQDLNSLWWDYVARFQMIQRPEGRNAPDWASKPHFTIAPVYYHNYLLGEVFAAQLRNTLSKVAGHEGPASTLSFNGRKDFGALIQEKVFAPGQSMPWPQFVENVTGEPLTAKHFGAEVQ